jgi:hypothetical protein
MSIRSTILAAAVLATATLGAGSAVAEPTGATQTSGSGFQCANKLDIQVVSCVGSIAVLPITIDVNNVKALDNNQLNVLSGDLNKLSVLDGGILNNDKILNDVEVTVLQDFLNKFVIDVTKNDIDVCTAVLGVSLCK